jgi:hypothetical protein
MKVGISNGLERYGYFVDVLWFEYYSFNPINLR